MPDGLSSNQVEGVAAEADEFIRAQLSREDLRPSDELRIVITVKIAASGDTSHHLLSISRSVK